MTENVEAIPPGLCQCGCGGATKLAMSTQHGAVKGQPNRFLAGHQARAAAAAGRVHGAKGPIKATPRTAGCTVRPACPTERCGDQDPGSYVMQGWIYVLVAGSREPGRWFCCGQCATFGMALAELRSLADELRSLAGEVPS